LPRGGRGNSAVIEDGVDIWQGRAKGGEVQMKARVRLGGSLVSLFRAREGVWFEVREGVQAVVDGAFGLKRRSRTLPVKAYG
jgi:hypothetical protein